MSEIAELVAHDLTIGYKDRTILTDVNLAFPKGKITAIIGANACGKSTLLRSLSRLQKPLTGSVTLNSNPLHKIAPKTLARQLGLLPQSPIAPEGIIVSDLVGRGRNPHLGLFSRWSEKDDQAVYEAMQATNTLELSERYLEELSGGQKQRVWIAMALAQQTDILLLDEPTTFLDVKNQVEVLDLLVEQNQKKATTIIMVLHDLNLATRYADHLVAVANGGIYATGTPHEVINTKTVRDVFGLENIAICDPLTDRPHIIPKGRQCCGLRQFAQRQNQPLATFEVGAE